MNNTMYRIISGLLALLTLLTVMSNVKAETVTYYFNDLSGSPVAAMDSSGNRIWRESYQPFGEKRGKPSASNNDIGFTGHQNDDFIGLTYMQARYYDATLGRFYGIDPVGFTGEVDTFNRYLYVANNPYKYSDPSGGSKVATLIELTKKGALEVRNLTRAEAVRARQRGQNIKVLDGRKGTATSIERAANHGSKSNIIKGGDHASGHIVNKYDVQKGAEPIRGMAHVQTEGVGGHTFYTFAGGGIVDGLSVLAEALEWAEVNLPNTMGVINFFDPTYDKSGGSGNSSRMIEVETDKGVYEIEIPVYDPTKYEI